MKRNLLFILFSFLFIIDTKAQCAMCRAVLETGGGEDMAKGINDGIVYLMVIPYVLVAGIGFLIYKKFNNPKKPSV